MIFKIFTNLESQFLGIFRILVFRNFSKRIFGIGNFSKSRIIYIILAEFFTEKFYINFYFFFSGWSITFEMKYIIFSQKTKQRKLSKLVITPILNFCHDGFTTIVLSRNSFIGISVFTRDIFFNFNH